LKEYKNAALAEHRVAAWSILTKLER